MDEVEIKQELPCFEDQCRVCLSVGRNLTPLGQYTSVFKRIVADLDYEKYGELESIQLCWECISVLRRVHTFLLRASKALQTLQSVGGEYIYGSLSNLATVTLNDTHSHSVYMCEVKVVTDSKQTSDHSDQCDGDEPRGDECVDDGVKSEEMVAAVVEPKKPKVNRWAIKRALQNKKPKFKIITGLTEECFVQRRITNEEVALYLQRERDSEYFKSKKLKCVQCAQVFSDEKALSIHNDRYHSKQARYLCELCGAGARHKRRLAAHVRAHGRAHVCALCTFSCCARAHVQHHQLKAHPTIFRCLKCGLKFGSRKEFYKHYKEWHEKFICDHCGVSFKMRYCIKNHIRKQHSPFECRPCNKRFARYNGLWLHNKTRHAAPPGTGTPAYCVECDRRYPDVYRYRWHLANSARHNRRDKPRVACPGCDKVFSKNIYMKDHYNLVHLKFYKYRCEQCDRNFIRNADLVKHTRRVHEGILPPKNKICYMCGRGFTTNKILLNHVRTHTGERPHACALCGARFAQRTTLAAHHRAIHTTRT